MKPGMDERAAVDLWERTLQQLPSTYGRMVYLASLRSANSERYEHHGLAMRFSPERADTVLRASHEQVFQDWLALSVREQKADIDLYLSSLDDNKQLVVETWLKIMPFHNLPPGRARGVEADLFLADFRVLLELLRNEYRAAVPDRGA
jgi:hypothetical protein